MKIVNGCRTYVPGIRKIWPIAKVTIKVNNWSYRFASSRKFSAYSVKCGGYKTVRLVTCCRRTMLIKGVFGSQFRVRTFGKTICVLAIVTVSAVIVWIRTFALLTVFQEVKYAGDMNASSHESYRPLQTLRPSLLHMYESQVNTHHTSSSEDTNFTAVILLTYMRSGSSFTGEILQQNDNVFYVFEPLRMLGNLEKTGKPLHWMNGTIRALSSLNIMDVKRQALTGWLTCNFSMVYAKSFDDWYFFSFGKKTGVYSDCIMDNFGTKLNFSFRNSASNNSKMHIRTPAYRRGLGEKCLQDLQNACLSSKFRIVKTIRTPMNLADEILTEVKDGKVIHLIRDPRETVISQAHYHGCPGGTSSVMACSNWHCKKVLDDTKVKQRILTGNPGRVLTVLYQHIVSYPSAMTKVIYKFIGMKFSEKIGDYVTMIAQGGNVTGCNVCGQSWQARLNSVTSLNQGNVLTKINPNVISYIQKVCRTIIRQYGYRVYRTSQSQYNSLSQT